MKGDEIEQQEEEKFGGNRFAFQKKMEIVFLCFLLLFCCQSISSTIVSTADMGSVDASSVKMINLSTKEAGKMIFPISTSFFLF